MNIKDTSLKDTKPTNIEENSKAVGKLSFSGSNDECDDLKTFNELMLAYQDINQAVSGNIQNGNNLNVNIDEKFLKSLKRIGLLPVDFNFSQNKYVLNHLSYLQNIKTLEENRKFDIDSLTDQDLKSIKQMLENPGMTIQNLNQQNLQLNFAMPDDLGQISYKTLDFSKTLFNLIEYSHKSQKPIRLDFNNDSSVILKIDKEGRLSAEFLSSSKAMENLLKENLHQLKSKLDSEGINYKEITYRDNSKKQNKKDNKGG